MQAWMKAGLVLTAVMVLMGDDAGCSSETVADKREREQTARITEQASTQVGVPAVTRFTEKKNLKMIYELRRAAKSRIEAIEQEALTRIERLSLEAQTEIIAHGLDSDIAKAFLNTMPKLDDLMPSVRFEDIQKLVDSKRAERKSTGYLQ